MFLGSLISLLDERPVLVDHGIEILVCSDGCFGKYVSSFFARFGLINLRGGWGRSRGVFFRCILRTGKVGWNVQGGFYSPGIKEKDPGQGYYFSVGPGWL